MTFSIEQMNENVYAAHKKDVCAALVHMCVCVCECM